MTEKSLSPGGGSLLGHPRKSAFKPPEQSISEMAEEHMAAIAAEAVSALRYLPCPGDQAEWLTLSMSAHAAGIPYDIWDEWCQTGPGYDHAKNRSRWDSFNAEKPGGITEATLFRVALDAGWRPTPEYAGAVGSSGNSSGAPGEETEILWDCMAAWAPNCHTIRGHAIAQQLPAEAVLFTAVATVGLRLEPGVMIEPFNSGPPLPATSYVVIRGGPSAGKSRSVKCGAGHVMDDRGVLVLSNAPSGQSIPARIIKEAEAEASALKTLEAAAEDTRAMPPTQAEIKARMKTRMLATWDEAGVFDGASSTGRSGDKMLIPFLSSAWFGHGGDLSQDAATAAATRRLPEGFSLSMAAVICAQPGTAAAIFEDDTGMSSRFIVCEAAPPDASKWLENRDAGRTTAAPWAPLHFDVAIPDRLRPPGGMIPHIAIDDEVKREADALAQYLACDDEETAEMIASHLGLTDADGWDAMDTRHAVVKIIRIAAGISIIEGAYIITPHVWRAAVAVLRFSEASRRRARQAVIDERRAEATAAAHSRGVLAVVADSAQADELEKKMVGAVRNIARKADRQGGVIDRRTAWQTVKTAHRTQFRNAGIDIDDLLDMAESDGILQRRQGVGKEWVLVAGR